MLVCPNLADTGRHCPESDAVMTAPDDLAALLVAAADGDQRAWEAIVDRFTNLLWSIGRSHRLDTNTINDVVQTTWLRLLENMHSIRDPERLAGWLATTGRRECLAALRRSGREAPGLEPEEVVTIPDVSRRRSTTTCSSKSATASCGSASNGCRSNVSGCCEC